MRLLCGLALLGVLPIVLSNAVLYRWRASALHQMVACDRPERLGLLNAVWAFAQECAADAVALLLTLIGWCVPRRRDAAGTRGPVILIHGWGLNRGSLWLLRRRLLRDGCSPVCCVDYRWFGADVEHAGKQLRATVENLTTRGSNHPPLTLIGHGLGGLVLRYYVRRYPAPSVRRIITLGTPHLGTDVARLLRGATAGLVPGSSSLSTLNAADRVPLQFDVIAIHSTFDAVILPPQNAEYPGAFNVQIDDVGHCALLFSSKVYRLLAENLAAPLSH